MRFTAMATGHSPGLEIGGNKGIFFNHHPGDIKFLGYRASHQYSLDHSANIAQRRLKARSFFPRAATFSSAAFRSKKKPTTLNKYQQSFESGLFGVSPASASDLYEHILASLFHWMLYKKQTVIQTLKVKMMSGFQLN
jgi:hypothetical protein